MGTSLYVSDFATNRALSRHLRFPQELILRLRGEPLGISESAPAEFSFSTPSAPPLTIHSKLIVLNRVLLFG